MTPEELALTPLKKGDQVYHEILGHCFYISKVRNQKDMVVVETLDKMNVAGNMKETRRKVHVSTLQYGGNKAAKKQPTNLILCHCEKCGLKARIARRWLKVPPACWNPECESWNQERGRGDDLTIEIGERGDGVLDVDRSEMMKRQNAETYGTYNEGEKAPRSAPASYIPGKDGEDDVLV